MRLKLNPPLDSAEIRLLTEVGFLAAAKADVGRAKVIFSSLELLRPNGAFVYSGLAFAYLNAARYEDGVTVLDKGLPHMAAEDVSVLQSIRAMALGWAGRASESTRALALAGTHPLAEILRTPATTLQHKEN